MKAPEYRPPPLDIGDDRPELVKKWQQQLRNRGWHIEVDGIYGKESRRLCANFEMEHGLTSNGDVDKATWDATWEAGSTKPQPTPGRILKKGDTGEDVRKWQRQVNNRGWPELKVDGDFGDQTERICKEFQEFEGLPVTGKVDEDTWKEAWLEKTPVAAM
ncbi:peptidoglycan-binding protein [Nonomuraea sp. GTA35]|uniref:peptidoglycan-binding domain-containing protein n=1 Tax=Nonomuraea sp. GTA35 TaxID=1676746 RepID=UPI0035C012F7